MPFYKSAVQLFGYFPIVLQIMGVILLVLQALLFNKMIIEHHLLASKTYVPALIYILLMSCTPTLLFAHPALFSNFFLIIALNRLFATYRAESVFTKVYDAGLYTGLASLFYLPALFMLPFLWVALAILRPFVWREWVISFMGLVTPYFFVFTYYYWFSELDVMAGFFEVNESLATNVQITVTHSIFVLAAGAGAGLLMGIKTLRKELASSVVKVKNFYVVLNCFLIFSIIPVAVNFNLQLFNFAAAGIPVSIYLSNFFSKTKHPVVEEIVFYIFLGSIIYTQVVNMG